MHEFKIGDCVKVPIQDDTGVVIEFLYTDGLCNETYPIVMLDNLQTYQGYMIKFLIKITPEERLELILRNKND
jgi:hypothetical protein